MLTRHAFSHRHPFFLGFMRQHGAANNVTHRPYIGQIGAAIFVDHHKAALIQLQADGIDTQAFRMRNTAN